MIGIDEAQFFDEGLVEVCNELANRGVRVVIAGLDMDFKGLPFGPIPALCAVADEVTKVHAICVKCGNLAYVSHRTVANERRVLLGEKEEYEPLCRCCYQKARAEEQKTPKMLNQKKITFDSFIRGVLSGAVVIAILYLLKRLSGVLLPFSWLG